MKYSKYRKWLGLATMSASLAMLPTAVFAEEGEFEEMEEIIVTGSFIKRTTASSAWQTLVRTC